MSDSKEMPLTRRGHDNKVLGRSGRPLLVVVEGVNIKPPQKAHKHRLKRGRCITFAVLYSTMIDAGLRAIGGLDRVIGDHREVLLKPNTNQRDPFPSIT
ncbi:MAG: hypothetical protein ABSB22_21320, partial [Thermodesulfobacteriota bacterium]